MRCYLCGFLCDYHDGGLCSTCRELVNRNNERVMMLALLQDILSEVGGYLKIKTIERIEAALRNKPPFG